MNIMNQKDSDKPIEKDLRISMEERFFEKLEIIKTYYGIKNNTEMIRVLINERYRVIRPHEEPQNINEKIIASVFNLFNQYRKKGKLQPQDLADTLGISMDRLLKVVVESKHKIEPPIDLLEEV